jgi:hypothetical protein
MYYYASNLFAACANDLQSEDNRNRILFPPRRKGAKVMEKSGKRLRIILILFIGGVGERFKPPVLKISSQIFR